MFRSRDDACLVHPGALLNAFDVRPVRDVGNAQHIGQVDHGIPTNGCAIEVGILADRVGRQETAVRSTENHNLRQKKNDPIVKTFE